MYWLVVTQRKVAAERIYIAPFSIVTPKHFAGAINPRTESSRIQSGSFYCTMFAVSYLDIHVLYEYSWLILNMYIFVKVVKLKPCDLFPALTVQQAIALSSQVDVHLWSTLNGPGEVVYPSRLKHEISAIHDTFVKYRMKTLPT